MAKKAAKHAGKLQKKVAVVPKAAAFDWITPDLRVLAMPVSDLILDPKNAKDHGESDLEKLSQSLKKYGQRKPINVQVTPQGNIIRAGNGTYLAALKLGWTHIAAVKIEEDDASATGFAIADNRLSELSTWNKDRLNELLGEFNFDDDFIGALATDLLESLDADASAALEDLEPTEPQPESPPAGGSDSAEKKPRANGQTTGPRISDWKIVIDCEDEMQQQALLDEFDQRKMKCRALMS